MGEMADYYADLAMSDMFDDEHYDEFYNDVHYKDILNQYLKGKLHWVTKDNRQILIKDMTNSHLLNSIKWIDKNHSSRTVMQELKDILIIEKEKRRI